MQTDTRAALARAPCSAVWITLQLQCSAVARVSHVPASAVFLETNATNTCRKRCQSPTEDNRGGTRRHRCRWQEEGKKSQLGQDLNSVPSAAHQFGSVSSLWTVADWGSRNRSVCHFNGKLLDFSNWGSDFTVKPPIYHNINPLTLRGLFLSSRTFASYKPTKKKTMSAKTCCHLRARILKLRSAVLCDTLR